MANVGAVYNISNHTIVTQHEVPTHLLQEPAQTLSFLVSHIAIIARHKHASTQRTALHGVEELDHAIITSIFHNNVTEVARVASYYASLGAHTAKRAHRLDHDESSTCPHCNMAVQDDTHLWMCTHRDIQHARQDTDDQLQLLIVNRLRHDLPTTVKLGLPPALTARNDALFWDSQPFHNTQGLTSDELLHLGIGLDSTMRGD